MLAASPFEIPTAGLFTATYLAKVVEVEDGATGRVVVRLYNFDGFDDQDAQLSARVAVPFAGGNRGAFLLPDKDDEVLVAFVNGDPRLPVVVGSLWNGAAKAKESLGGDGKSVDRWTLVGKAGSRIAIEEPSSGQPTISFTTPGKVSGTLTDQGGGKLELKAAGATVTLDSSGVSVQTAGTVQVKAGTVNVNAGQVNVNAALAKFSGIVQCMMLKTTTCIADIYKPGVGNVW